MNAAGDPAQEAPRLTRTAREVAHAVLREGPITRAGLAWRLGTSIPSLTRPIRELIKARLVRERPAGSAAAGRAASLQLNEDAAHFLGLSITAGAVRAVVTDLAGAVITRRHRSTRARIPGTVLSRVTGLIGALHAADARIRGVGVGIGGPVADGSTVRHVDGLGWGEVEVGGHPLRGHRAAGHRGAGRPGPDAGPALVRARPRLPVARDDHARRRGGVRAGDQRCAGHR